MTRRAWAFAVLGLCAAAVLAAVVRHWRRGGEPPPYQPSPVDARYWNLDIYDDFFVREQEPGGRAVYVSRRPLARSSSFPVVKSTDTFRVFVIGGSVAFQYESEPARIAGRRLQDALQRVLPGRRVEVVPCGMGAYDSYREALVLKEVLRHDPDLVVLMSGNNEARADAGPPPRRVVLALRLRRLLGLWRPQGDASAAPSGPSRSGHLGSFSDNLRGMVLAARRAGAATVLCTLPRRLDNLPGGPLPPWLWEEGFFQAWNPEGPAGLSSAAAFWRRALARDPSQDYAHYFLARALERQGDGLGALKEFAAAKRCREPWDTNPVVRATAAELGAPLADLEAAFDALPYAREGRKIYRDPTHWYRFLDPLVSHEIARSLVRRPGPAMAAPRADPAEAKDGYIDNLAWAISSCDRAAPRVSEEVLVSFDDLRRLDDAAFAALPRLKDVCREAVSANIWSRSGAAAFDLRWAFALAHAGEAYRRAGQPLQALELFSEALRAAPGMAFWRLYQALALRQLGRRREAAGVLDSIAEPARSLPEIRSVRRLWGLDPAPAEAQPAPPAPPPPPLTPVVLLQRRAEDYAAAGRPQEALSVLRPELRREPPDEALLLTALRIAVSAGDRSFAEECIARGRRLRLPPRRAALLAEALRSLGRPEEALAAIREALVRWPGDAKLLNDKGVLESLLGRPRQAQADLEGAIAADPDFASAYLSLGAVLASRGELARARRTYDAALARRRIRRDPAQRRALQEALRVLGREP
ncbi:MAG: tetratricopeptide repeat protein [Elusimicrobia bacterium]|nr:tetratricopeptide repeat protein [Elusimicrobiota bacterium]